MNGDEVLVVSPVLRHAVPSRNVSPNTSREGFAYRPHLDGLRAISVLAVVLFHCSVPGFSHGYLGVDTFFVLSGFLITSLLLLEVERTGTIELSHFYAKRVRRLMPGFVLVVLSTAVAYKLLLTASEVEEVRDSFHAAALYVENFYEINVADDYWKQEYDTSPLRHCWSLSVEEQFYFFFSLCLKVLFVWLHAVQFRRSCAGFYRRMYAKVSLVVSIAIAGSLFRGGVLLETSSATRAYMDSIARVYQLLTGTMLAMRAAFDRVSASSRARIDAMWVNVTFALLLALYCAGLVLTSVNTVVAGIVSTALSAGLIEVSEGHTAASCAAIAVLSSTVAVFIGKLSYGIYLWHFPLIILMDKLVWDPAAAGGFSWRIFQAMIVATLAIAMAYITRRFVEGPVSKISVSRRSTARSCFALGVVLVPLVLLVLLSSILWTPSLGSNDHVDIGGRSSNLTLGQYDIKFENVFEGGTEAGDVNWKFQCCSGPCVEKAPNRTSDKIVALAGDSHAQKVYNVWKYAAERLGLELRFCSAPATPPYRPVVPGKFAKDYADYFHKFSEVADYLVIHCYKLQCLSALEHNSFRSECLEGPSAVRTLEVPPEELEDRVAELPDVKDDFIARVSAWLDAAGARAMKKVFFILPEPMANFWVPRCKGDCHYPVDHWVSRIAIERWLEEIAQTYSNLVIVDMDEVLCPKGMCPGKLASGKPSSPDYHHIHTARWFAVANDYLSVLQSMGMEL